MATGLTVGEVVRVALPRGSNKRGVWSIHPMYVTSQEAKFDGATGTITDIKPDGTHNIPLYLVDFTTHENRVAIPWTKQWFRDGFLQRVQEPPKAGKADLKPTSATHGEEVYSQDDKVGARERAGQ